MTAVALVRQPPLLPLPPVTELEDQFVREYLALGGNATRAYMRVRPQVKPLTARTEGSRLLAKPNVQEHLAHLRREMQQHARLTPDQIILDLENLLLADIGEIWEPIPGTNGRMRLRPLDELTPEQRRAIQEYSVTPTQTGESRKVKLYSRVDVAKLLLEVHGKLRKVVEHEGEVVHRVMALPAAQPTPEEWAKQFAPRLPAPARPKAEEIQE